MGLLIIDESRRRPSEAPNLHSLRESVITFLMHAFFAILAAAVLHGLPIAVGSSVPNIVQVGIAVALPIAFTVFTLSISLSLFGFYWVAVALTQNFFTGVWASPSATFIPLYITEIKTVILFIAFGLSIGRVMELLSTNTWVRRAVIFYFMALIVAGFTPGESALQYFRNFTTTIIVILLFSALSQNLTIVEKIVYMQSLCKFAASILICGVVLELLMGTELWRLWVRADINGALNSLSDTTSLLGVRLSRLGGFIVEPTNAGYAAATILVIGISLSSMARTEGLKLVQWPYMTAALICLFASGAKSGMLMIAISAVVISCCRLLDSTTVAALTAWAVSLGLVLGYVALIKPGAVLRIWSDPIGIIGGDSTTFHLAGLVSGVKYALTNVRGAGLGVGGNFSRDRSESWAQWIGTGSESSWGVLAYQTGLLGLVAFVVLILVFSRQLGAGTGVLVTAWSAAALFAEAFFGPQVAGLIAVAAGVLSRWTRNLGPNGTEAPYAPVR